METKEQSKIQKLMKSKLAKAGVSVALVGTLALAGIGAYFTGTDTVENRCRRACRAPADPRQGPGRKERVRR